MFLDFLNMMGNYESRKVGRDELENGALISTCEVTDSDDPFETGIQHPEYHEGSFIIVQTYRSREDAEKGHTKWVEVMKNPPEYLEDKGTSGIGQLAAAVGCETKFYRQINKEVSEGST